MKRFDNRTVARAIVQRTRGHTTPAALRDAQAHISAIRTRLVQEGRL